MGIEADPGRFKISEKCAGLWDGKIGIREGLVEEVDLDDQFDFVTFLNVLHHVTDPMLVMKKLASLCKGTLIVELRQPTDKQFLFESFHSPRETDSQERSIVGRAWGKGRLAAEQFFMARLMNRVPLLGIASVEYHRSYF